MGAWVAKLLGVPHLEGGQVEHLSVQWTRLDTPFHVLLFILAAAGGCYVIGWFYRQEPAYCPRRRKALLTVLRALGFTVLLAILAGPVLTIVKGGLARSKVVILVDVSQSMDRKDPYVADADKFVAARVLGLVPLEDTGVRRLTSQDEARLKSTSRLDLAKALLRNRQIGLLEQLQGDYDVQLWSFARAQDLAPVGSGRPGDQAALDALKATGVATEIGGALRAVAQRLRGQPLAGILLLSDGDNNRGEEPTLVAEGLAARVFPVGIGAPQARDAAVAHLFMESKLFKDDPAPIYVRLKQHGFDGEQGQLVFSLDGEELARQPVTLRKGGEQTEAVRITPRRAGKSRVRVEFVLPEPDSEPANNVKEREIEVVDTKIRVLVLESTPRWEFRFLTAALLRDRRVECRILLRAADPARSGGLGPAFLKEFPKKDDLLKYHAIVFGNLPNDAFWTEQELALIQRFVVAEGGGIWFIAGRNHFPDEYKDSKLELLLPVEFDRMTEATLEDETQAPRTEGFRVLLTHDGRSHSLTRLEAGASGGSEEENAALWDLLPDLYWFHRAKRAKLGATVLLACGGSRAAGRTRSREAPPPLLVTQQVGRGRVLYSAVDELWRMRFPPELGPDALERFYGHAIQYLGLAKCLGASPRIEISTNAEQYSAGETVRVTVRILSRDTYDPSSAERVAAAASDLERETPPLPFDLLPIPGQPGMFRGELPARDFGHFRISLPEEGRGEENAFHDYTVVVPQLERDSPEMKADLLDQLAKASRPPGLDLPARMYTPDQAGRIPAELRASERALPPVRLEEPLWDAPLPLILFVLCLGFEWWLRKRSDLL